MPIGSMAELEERIQELGFLPFFKNRIKGFSISEISHIWWPNEDEDGPWEWKGPLIREGNVAYGKFFNRKAGYVSLEWLPDFINYRRSKHLAPNDDAAGLDELILQTISEEGSVTAQQIRDVLGIGRRRRRKADDLVDTSLQDVKISLDPILTRLMMEGRVVASDFIYNIDRNGNPYGWGIAKYSTPEHLYGSLKVDRTPAESRDLILRHLSKVLPATKRDERMRFIR